MVDEHRGPLAAGASLMWRKQNVLWWVFAVNLLCGVLGTIPAMLTLHDALGHSLAGGALARGFDLGEFAELFDPPVSLMRASTTSYLFAFLFFFFMLWVSGGILKAFEADRKLTTEEFFAASGAFFWRFVRLVLLSLIPLIAVGMLHSGSNKLGDFIGKRALDDRTGFFIGLAGTLIVIMLALLVRLWFDVARVRTVVQNERRMWRNTWRALGITRRSVGSLLGMYFLITLVAWAVLAIGIAIWTKLPPTAWLPTLLILELIMLTQLGARLWQQASLMVWYKRHAELVPADAVEYTTPAPVEVVEYPLPGWTAPANVELASPTPEPEAPREKEPDPLSPADD